MSAASLSATPSLNTLPERAFTLYCAGLRSPAIAQHLGVPERTVRYWIAKIRDDIAVADTAHMQEEFFRAVEHLHQISAAAWQAFEREQNQAPSGHNVPAATTDALDASNVPDSLPIAPTITNPHHGPRYLRLALDAQRQITHLLGLSDHTRTGTSSPNTDSTPAPAPAPTLAPVPDSRRESEIPAKSAMDVPAESEIPAKTATTSGSPLPVGGARGAVGASGRLRPKRSLLLREGRTGRPRDHRGAERAQSETAGSGVRFPIPAKTATPSRRDRPARRHRRR